ncbi:MAG: adenosine deaminase family protein [Minicystis sp.]
MNTAPLLADLHRHLDGSLRPSTVAELAARAHLEVPADLPFFAGMGLSAALSRFGFTLSLLQGPEAVRRVAAEMCEDAAAEGVSTLEIRFAPQLHRSASLEAIVDAALEGAAGRAGVILCGLYGEPPAVMEGLVAVAASRQGVVGIDLAGGPAPGHGFGMEAYAASFRRAGELGLGRTVHAGEGRPAAEIRVAVEQLGAQRIGHGTTLLDDPAIVELVVSRGVVIEACPTSNVHTGVIARVEDHPLSRWLDAGVRCCVCADNTLLSATDARRELALVMGIAGMDEAKRARVIAAGHAAAFSRRSAIAVRA